MTNLKKSVYFDSTIPSYMFDKRKSILQFCEITRTWWKEERKNFDIYTSIETIAELAKGDYPKKDEILDFARKLQQLEPSADISQIVNFYIQHKLMPADIEGDAIHLAYASFYKIDFLLTWNCNHLANANKKQHIRIINNRLNIFVPEIITPLELFSEK